MKPRFAIGLCAAPLFFSSCASKNPPAEVVVLVPDSSEMSSGFHVDFVEDIKPILESRCLGCHNTESGMTSLSFESRALVVAENERRQIVIPGEPERSSLFLVTVLPDHFAEAMPVAGHRLDKGETWLVYKWILQGADWPEDEVLKAPETAPRPKKKKEAKTELPPDIT